jgi:hypothetical protein
MSVGLLVVRLLYRFYVCVHLSKWFTLFQFLVVCLMVAVSSFTLAGNVLRLGAVPHITNLIINHCTLSGIALNRCWAQYFT